MTTTMPPGTLLATGAHDAERPAGPCAICERDMLTGERIARLLSGAKTAHAPCIASATWRPRRTRLTRES
jgi:hypothetical protein